MRLRRNYITAFDLKFYEKLHYAFYSLIVASVGVTPRSKQLGVTPRTPLFEGKNPENQKLKISIK